MFAEIAKKLQYEHQHGVRITTQEERDRYFQWATEALRQKLLILGERTVRDERI